jgi:hypothetical protein
MHTLGAAGERREKKRSLRPSDRTAAGWDSGEVKRSPREVLGPCNRLPRATPQHRARASHEPRDPPAAVVVRHPPS